MIRQVNWKCQRKLNNCSDKPAGYRKYAESALGRRLSNAALVRRIIITAWAVLLICLTAASAFAVTWEFDTPELGKVPGKNPFTPRGYLVDTGRGQQWLSSGYTNDGEIIKYTGVTNGVDWLEAKDSYKLYAMTDRNPTPGRTYLIAWKNGKKINGFGNLAGTPGRGEAVDPSGNGTCWVIPLDGFTFEPGCYYEFGFYQGMMANNGITLVLSEDGKGYIQAENNHDGTWNWDSGERKRYETYQYEEYEFLDHWEKNVDDETGEKSFFNFHFVPMRFSVQTYADLSIWNRAASEAQEFLDSVTESDYAAGKYVRANVKNLQATLDDLQAEADGTVKRQLQTLSNANQRKMAAELSEKLTKAMTEKPEKSDMEDLLAAISEAKDLYKKTKDNTGTKEGQYSKTEVQALADEITRAEKLNVYDTQSDIDAETKALEDQILRVKASMIRPAVRTFYDKATGIMVIAPADAFPDDVSMQVRRIDEDAASYKAMTGNLAKTETQHILYDIAFISGGNRIEPDEEIQIQIPIPAEMEDMTVSLLKVSDDGELTMLNAAQSNGIKIFKSRQVDLFALTAHKKTEEEREKENTAKSSENKNINKNSKSSASNKNGGTSEDGGNTDSDSDNDSQSDGNKNTIEVTLNIQKNIREEREKERELSIDKKNKEEFKPPEAAELIHDSGDSILSEEVTRRADPKTAVYGGIGLAGIALVTGVRNISWKRKKPRGKNKKQ